MPEESTPRRESKRTVQQMVIVGVIASAVGIAIGLSLHSAAVNRISPSSGKQ